MKTTISIERNAENISYTITKNATGSYDVSKTVSGETKTAAVFVFDTFQYALDWVRERIDAGVKS
jgi:hypothetical protein